MFETLQRPKAYTQIVDQILEQIRSGGFSSGDRLPPERDLAASFGVSRGTLKEAIRVLEHAGMLEVRVGSGTYVSAESTATDVWLRARAAAQGDYSPLDVITARMAIEPVSTGQAVRRATPYDIQSIEMELSRHTEAVASDQDPTVHDLGFHMAIARASKNEVLETLIGQLVDWMSQSTWRQLKGQARQRAGEGTFIREHDDILQAIRSGDASRGSAAMLRHLTTIEREIREYLASTDESVQ